MSPARSLAWISLAAIALQGIGCSSPIAPDGGDVLDVPYAMDTSPFDAAPADAMDATLGDALDARSDVRIHDAHDVFAARDTMDAPSGADASDAADATDARDVMPVDSGTSGAIRSGDGRVHACASLQIYTSIGSLPDATVAATFAREVDLVSVNPDVRSGSRLDPYAADMVTAHPGIVIAPYEKSVHLYSPIADPSATNPLPDPWYAHYADGGVVAPGYSNVWVMQPDGTGAWTDNAGAIGDAGSHYDSAIAFHVAYVLNDLDGENAHYAASNPYNGIWLDSAGVDSLLGQVVPGTTTRYVGGTWYPLVDGAVDAVRSARPNAVVIANGVGSNGSLVQHADGVMFENWFRGPYSPISTYPTDSAWRTDMQDVMTAQSNGAFVEVLIKMWSAGATSGSDTSVEPWRRFAVASYFIADSGALLFEFSLAQTIAPWTVVSGPSYAVALGAPTVTKTDVTLYRAAMNATGSLYMRQYANGVVLVNTSGAPLSTTVGGPWHDLDGTPISGSYSVAAHSGSILTP